MPKGSIRNPGTAKTMVQRKARASINAQDKSLKQYFAQERKEIATRKLNEKRAAAVSRKPSLVGTPAENPVKALKRRAAAKKGKLHAAGQVSLQGRFPQEYHDRNGCGQAAEAVCGHCLRDEAQGAGQKGQVGWLKKVTDTKNTQLETAP
jgi:uncharacterized protein YdaU (DUF1376 family)